MDHNISIEEAIESGFDEEMVNRYLEFYGKEKALKILQSAFMNPNKIIRMNSIQNDPDNTFHLLTEKGFKLTKLSSKWGYMVEQEPFSVGASIEYLKGYYMLQGIISQNLAELLNPKTSDTVLDIAASPGGKTSLLAQMMENEGAIIAIERFANRIPALKNNLSRLGVNNSLIYLMDGRHVKKLGLMFDKILVDAPCSGSGILRKDFSRKRGRTKIELTTLSRIQKQLLFAAIDSLKSNGTLVYSTCSMEPEENEIVINTAIKKKDIEILPIEIEDSDPGLTDFKRGLSSSLNKCQRVFPDKNKDGFFICLLKKK